MIQISTVYGTPPDRRLSLFLLLACLMMVHGGAGAEQLGKVPVSTVAVIKNLSSADSLAIADYYVRKRKLPAENVCAVRMTDVEECSYKEYEEQLKRPLQQFLAHLNHPIDYIVLTKG